MMQIAWPLFQFVIALAVVTVMIWILGAIGEARPAPLMVSGRSNRFTSGW